LRPAFWPFYDNRVADHRFNAHDNWVDAIALSLGGGKPWHTNGEAALVYDTQVPVAHGVAIRDGLVERGVTRMRVVLSHCYPWLRSTSRRRQIDVARKSHCMAIS